MNASDKLRLLVVDDEAHIVKLIREVGEEMGFSCHVSLGRDVFDAIPRIMPDVIALDIMMPDVDGIEVLQFLKMRKSEARIMLMSGNLEDFHYVAESMGLATGLKIDANLSKPFRLQTLRKTLGDIQSSLFADAYVPEKARA